MAKSKYIALGDNLKRLRKERNMTQVDLARILCVTNKAVSSWELGLSDPRRDIVDKLANVFSLDADELCYGPAARKNTSSPSPLPYGNEATEDDAQLGRVDRQSAQLLMEVFMHMNDENRKKLLKKARALLMAQCLEEFDE